MHIRMRNVRKSYSAASERLSVIDEFSLDVARGEFVSLLGPSGCGKTTLLRLIAGLAEPDGGEISVGGLTPAQAQARRAFGIVSQDAALLAWRTVAANVRLPMEIGTRREPDAERRVKDLLELVGLERYAGYYPHQLSGGMRQRVALARANGVGAPLLLMDEPFGALDEIARAEMRYDLLRIWETSRKTVVFVTHSIGEAAALSDRVIALSPRPARILAAVDVDLPRPRTRDAERRPEFTRCVERLRELLLRAAAERAPVG